MASSTPGIVGQLGMVFNPVVSVATVQNPVFFIQRKEGRVDAASNVEQRSAILELQLCLEHNGESHLLARRHAKTPFHQGIYLCLEHGLAEFKVIDAQASVTGYSIRTIVEMKPDPTTGRMKKHTRFERHDTYSYDVVLSVAFLPAAFVFRPETMGEVGAAEEFRSAQYGAKSATSAQVALSGMLQRIEFDTHTDDRGRLQLDAPDGAPTATNGSAGGASTSSAARAQPPPKPGKRGATADDDEDVDVSNIRNHIFKLTAPTDWVVELPDPFGLKCQLFAYQRKALAWMAWRESFSDARALLPAGNAPPRNAMLRLLAENAVHELPSAVDATADAAVDAAAGPAFDTFDAPDGAAAARPGVPYDPGAPSTSGRRVSDDGGGPPALERAGARPRTENAVAPQWMAAHGSSAGAAASCGAAGGGRGGGPKEIDPFDWVPFMSMYLGDHPLWEEVKLRSGANLFCSLPLGKVALGGPPEKADQVPGGLLSEEMGLGKTVEVIAMTLTHPRPPLVTVETGVKRKLAKPAACPPQPKKKQKQAKASSTNATELAALLDSPKPTPPAASASGAFIDLTDDSPAATPTANVLPNGILDLANGPHDNQNAPAAAARAAPPPRTSGRKSAGKKSGAAAVARAAPAPAAKPRAKSAPGRKRASDKPPGGVGEGLDDSAQVDVERCFGSTLVVAPSTLVQQWLQELERHSHLKVVLYDGFRDVRKHAKGLTRRRGQSAPGAGDLDEWDAYKPFKASVGDELELAAVAVQVLMRADVVVTTYNVLKEEVYMDNDNLSRTMRHERKYKLPGSPLAKIAWWRLVMDEAQMVGQPLSLIAQMARRIRTVHRWCVTGTPIGGGGLADLQSHLSVLCHDPFLSPDLFRSLIGAPVDRKDPRGLQRLRTLLKPLMWRNTKAVAFQEHAIPERQVRCAWLALPPAETSFYQHILSALKRSWDAHTAAVAAEAACAVASAAASSSSAHWRPRAAQGDSRRRIALAGSVAGELTQLRRACIHPQLTSYWRHLSQDLQLTQGGALSMADILRKMISSAQLELQNEERDLCVALNALALLKGLRIAALCDVDGGAAPMDVDGDEQPGQSKLDADLAAVNMFAIFKDAAEEELGGDALEAIAADPKLDDSDDDAAKPAAAEPAAKAPKAKGKRKSAASDHGALRSILRNLEESLRVEDGGIEALEADAKTSDTQIEGAEGTWRAWKHLGMSTASMLSSVHAALGSADAAGDARKQLLAKAQSLQSSAQDQLKAATARHADAVARVSDAREGVELRWADALAAGLPAPKKPEPQPQHAGEAQVNSVAVWLAALDRELDAARVADEAHREAAAKASTHTVLIGASSAVRTAIESFERVARKQKSAFDAVIGHTLTHQTLHCVRPMLQELDAEALPHNTSPAHLPPCFERPAPIALMRMAFLTPDADRARTAARAIRARSSAAELAFVRAHVDKQKRALERRLTTYKTAVDALLHDHAVDLSHLSTAALSATIDALRARLELLKALKDEHTLAAKVEERQDALDRSEHETLLALTGNSYAAKAALTAASKGRQGGRVSCVTTLKKAVADHTAKCRDLMSRKRFLTHQLEDMHGVASAAKSKHAPGASNAASTSANPNPPAAAANAAEANAATAGPSAPGVQISDALRARLAELAAEDDDEDVDENGIASGRCPICTERIVGTINLFPCGHAFCTACTNRLLAHPPTTCPMDRRPVKPAQVFKVAVAAVPASDAAAPEADGAEVTPEHSELRAIAVNGIWLTKVEALLRRVILLRRTAPDEKCLVFSQFPDALQLLGRALTVNNLKHASILSGEKTASRKALKSFQEDPDTTVFLLAMGAAAAGLTLTRANHVFLLEPALDPAIEQQAVARVHRFGQERPVHIVRLLIQNTVEPVILSHSEGKQKLFEAATHGEMRLLEHTSNELTSLSTTPPSKEHVAHDELMAVLAALFQEAA